MAQRLSEMAEEGSPSALDVTTAERIAEAAAALPAKATDGESKIAVADILVLRMLSAHVHCFG